MAIADVRKLELYAHQSVVDAVMARLQAWGRCEISVSTETAETAVERDSSDFETHLSDLRYVTRYLKPLYVDPVGGLGRMLGDRDDVSVDDLALLATKTDSAAMAAQVRQKERRLLELKAEATQIVGLRRTLADLSRLPYPLSMMTEGTAQVGGFIGTAAPEVLKDWLDQVAQSLGDDVECHLSIPTAKGTETSWGLVLYRRCHEETLLSLALKHSVSRLDLPASLKKMPHEEAALLEVRQTESAREEQAINDWLADFAARHMESLCRLLDYYSILEGRHEALLRGEKTEQVVVLRGWVATNDADDLQHQLAPWNQLLELHLTEPAEGDEPPVVLQNWKPSQPFETLTVLYGAPKYGGADPSLPMMPFFLLFFGMCYGDAGYGIIVALLAWWTLRRYPKMPVAPRRFMVLLKYCGIAAVVWGALTGGWMGDMIEAFPFLSFLRPVSRALTVVEPMKNPMLLLGFSLALGIVHIYLGIFIALFTNLRRGDKIAAIGDQGGWLFLLTGLLLLGGSSIQAELALWGKVLTGAGVLVLIATQGRAKPSLFGKVTSGALSLYNVTSYLGDVLSYSRLLALGLVGGAVAMIINLMAALVADVPYVGWLIALLIFLGGHLFSMVINILGAFVHPLRLQYVEFFGKFYESGGAMLDPLRYHTEYVNIHAASSESR